MRAQALSHFSYHATGGSYVLCDLQGGVMEGGKGVILTDPVILSRDREFGVTDLGAEGISTFFARHRCTKFCREHWQHRRLQPTTQDYHSIGCSIALNLIYSSPVLPALVAPCVACSAVLTPQRADAGITNCSGCHAIIALQSHTTASCFPDPIVALPCLPGTTPLPLPHLLSRCTHSYLVLVSCTLSQHLLLAQTVTAHWPTCPHRHLRCCPARTRNSRTKLAPPRTSHASTPQYDWQVAALKA